MPRAFAQALLICICALSSYHRTVAAEVTDEPAPACPAPKLQQTEWDSLELVKIGVRLTVPKKYIEKHRAVTIGDPVVATFRAGHLEEFTLKLDAPATGPLAGNAVIRQRNYEGYTECTETIGGHAAVIQSFREPHVIFMEQWYPAFAVHAVCDLGPGRILRYDATAATRQGQEELLAILRTLEFTR